VFSLGLNEKEAETGLQETSAFTLFFIGFRLLLRVLSVLEWAKDEGI
jgi:hypothetical protein